MRQRDALDRAEEIGQHRHVVARAVAAHDVLEQHRRPASARSRVWISVISSTGDTGAATRFKSAPRSSRAMKSRSEA